MSAGLAARGLARAYARGRAGVVAELPKPARALRIKMVCRRCGGRQKRNQRGGWFCPNGCNNC